MIGLKNAFWAAQGITSNGHNLGFLIMFFYYEGHEEHEDKTISPIFNPSLPFVV